jgi:hypothetical protein
MDEKLFNYLGEHTLRTSGHKQIRINLGPVRDDVTGEGRKLHNQKLHSLHSSPNTMNMIKLMTDEHVVCMRQSNIRRTFIEKHCKCSMDSCG